MPQDRWVFVGPVHEEVVDKTDLNAALLAAAQTGVRVEVLALPGERTKLGYEVPEGYVSIGAGEGSTGPELGKYGERKHAIRKVVEEIKAENATKAKKPGH